MEDLKDGIMSGGFEIAGASNVRQCSDLGVRSVMRISRVTMTRASAADVIWTPVS